MKCQQAKKNKIKTKLPKKQKMLKMPKKRKQPKNPEKLWETRKTQNNQKKFQKTETPKIQRTKMP